MPSARVSHMIAALAVCLIAASAPADQNKPPSPELVWQVNECGRLLANRLPALREERAIDIMAGKHLPPLDFPVPAVAVGAEIWRVTPSGSVGILPPPLPPEYRNVPSIGDQLVDLRDQLLISGDGSLLLRRRVSPGDLMRAVFPGDTCPRHDYLICEPDGKVLGVISDVRCPEVRLSPRGRRILVIPPETRDGQRSGPIRVLDRSGVEICALKDDVLGATFLDDDRLVVRHAPQDAGAAPFRISMIDPQGIESWSTPGDALADSFAIRDLRGSPEGWTLARLARPWPDEPQDMVLIIDPRGRQRLTLRFERGEGRSSWTIPPMGGFSRDSTLTLASPEYRREGSQNTLKVHLKQYSLAASSGDPRWTNQVSPSALFGPGQWTLESFETAWESNRCLLVFERYDVAPTSADGGHGRAVYYMMVTGEGGALLAATVLPQEAGTSCTLSRSGELVLSTGRSGGALHWVR